MAITALMPAAESTTRNSVSRINCTGAPGRPHIGPLYDILLIVFDYFHVRFFDNIQNELLNN
jgi:hypothetical protein